MKFRKLKESLIVSVIAGVMVVATACGSSGIDKNESATDKSSEQVQNTNQVQEGNKENEADNTKGDLSGEISLLLLNDMVDENKPMGAMVLKAAKEYEAKHPDVTINFQGTSQQDILDQFKTSALAGGGADITMMDNSGHAIDLAAMNLLIPVTDYIPKDKLLETYAEGPLNSGNFKGNYYSIPWYMDNCGLYYNVERLEELGIKPPTNWKEFETAIQKVTEAGYGGIISYLSAYEMYAFFYENGCPVIDTSGDIPEVVINNDAGKEAWEYWCGLHTKYNGFVESFKEATTWDKVYEAFANGEATFLLGGDWCASGIEGINPDLKYGILPMPEGKQKATILGGWTFNISKNTKNPELAFDFVQYMTSSETDYVLQADGKTPARNGVDYEKVLADYPERIVFAKQVPYTMPRPAIINEKTVDKIITDAFLTVLYDKKTPQEALDQLEVDLKTNIDQNYK